MRFRNRVWILLGSGLVLVSCVLESTDTRPGAAGEPCVSARNCRENLMCFIVTNDPESGTCIEPPAACNGETGCDCIDELSDQCEFGMTCLGILEEPTIACNHGGDLRQLGETCSLMRPCEQGLLCLALESGEAGVCQEQPECSTLNCECLEQLKEDECADRGWACVVLGRSALVECY